jgi:fused signal recognition particle receptor
LSFFNAIKKGLTKTRQSIVDEVQNIIGVGKLTEDTLEEFEEQLIQGDVGVEAALLMADALRDRALGKPCSPAQALDILTEVAGEMLPDVPTIEYTKGKVHVVLIIGVNGAGKTTTIGKLSNRFKKDGKRVLVAACDTFRAAAIEQLEAWAERSQVDLIKHEAGSDSAAVAFDALEAAQSREADVLIIDTAGRLHNKAHLMEELKKMSRVIKKIDPSAPHETLLVIDGNTGQNTVNQTKAFHNELPLDGLVVTKLDGTAKGGSVLAIANELKIPIKWLGLGEKIDDIAPFEKEAYIEGLFSKDLLKS